MSSLPLNHQGSPKEIDTFFKKIFILKMDTFKLITWWPDRHKCESFLWGLQAAALGSCPCDCTGDLCLHRCAQAWLPEDHLLSPVCVYMTRPWLVRTPNGPAPPDVSIFTFALSPTIWSHPGIPQLCPSTHHPQCRLHRLKVPLITPSSGTA